MHARTRNVSTVARCKDEGRRPFALQRFAFVFVQPKMAVGCLLLGLGDLAILKLQDTVLCRLCVCTVNDQRMIDIVLESFKQD